MKIQLNTDIHIDGNEALAAQVSATVEQALDRFSGRLHEHRGQHGERTSDPSLPGAEPASR